MRIKEKKKNREKEEIYKKKKTNWKIFSLSFKKKNVIGNYVTQGAQIKNIRNDFHFVKCSYLGSSSGIFRIESCFLKCQSIPKKKNAWNEIKKL